VTEATAPLSKARPLGQRIRDAVAAYPSETAIVVYALVVMGMTVAAYFAIFTLFQPYDDEGTLLTTVQAFAQGETLYRDVYSVYGPFYFEVFGGFFALTGLDVTTDASRTIVIVVWVGTSLLFGLAAHRLTGRLALGITGMIAAFGTLYVLVNEPMHPHGLCVLMLAAFTLLAIVEPTRRGGWTGAACGALVAALLLTKVNLGAFAIAAVAVAAVCTVGPLHRYLWLRLPVIVAFLAMPLLIAERDLSLGWVREMVLLETLAMVAILIAARPLRPERGDDEAPLVRWLLAASVGFGVAFAVILGAILLTGPSPADVYDGIVTQATRIRDLLVLQFSFPPAALDWGILAVGAAALTTLLRPGRVAEPTVMSGLLRAAAGLAILLSVARLAPFGLNPPAGNPVTLALVLAWVAAIPRAGSRESPHKRFLRVLLPALAVAEALQVYPVAGSQTGIAAVTFVPVGALCLADALSDLRMWAATRRAPASDQLKAVVAVASVALAGMFALNSILRPAVTNAILYRDQPKLPLTGASLMHLPAADVETYAGLVDLLHRYRCSTFIGYPSLNSLYLWSGLKAPPPQIPNAWMKALDRAQQQRVVDEMRATPRPCAIRNDERAGPYLQGAPPPDLPLVNYVLNDFESVAEIGGFQFLLPKRSAEAPS
jgi:hypothetical protein